MIDFTAIDEDLERTQDLPLLTPPVLREEALKRERTAQIEIVKIMRHNVQLTEEIERLRLTRHDGLHLVADLPTPTTDQHRTTEERLFEVCGALRDMLARILSECESRDLALGCERSARRTLDESCDRLESILSAPGFCAPEGSHNSPAPAEVATAETPTFRFKSLMLSDGRMPSSPVRAARVSRLQVDWS